MVFSSASLDKPRMPSMIILPASNMDTRSISSFPISPLRSLKSMYRMTT